MSKKIVIKEIDKLISLKHKGRVIVEYLIYMMEKSGSDFRPIAAYTEIGEEAKNIRVNELILLHFMSDNQSQINNEEIIENVVFEQ